MNLAVIQSSNTIQQAFTPTKENIALVKATVAKNATDNELALFLHLSQRYNLDPFAKEIWFIKYKDQPQIFTSRDGYLKIAHASGQFDGMESYTIDGDDGKPIKAVAVVYRKDMTRPFKSEVKFSEYNQGNQVWKQYPSAMLIKVAEVFALKRAFQINGMVTREEMSDTPPAATFDESKALKADPVNRIDDSYGDTVRYITGEQRTRLWTIATKHGWDNADVKQILQDTYGICSSKEIPADKYDEIVELLACNTNKEVA